MENSVSEMPPDQASSDRVILIEQKSANWFRSTPSSQLSSARCTYLNAAFEERALEPVVGAVGLGVGLRNQERVVGEMAHLFAFALVPPLDKVAR